MARAADENLVFDILKFLNENGIPQGAGSAQCFTERVGYDLADATDGRLVRLMDDSG